MSVLTKNDLIDKITNLAGENNTDDVFIEILEDVEDTFSDYEDKIGEDWKSKYEENDSMWREKYRERFYSGGNDDRDITTENKVKNKQKEDVIDDGESITFDDLFKEREG